MSGRKRDILDPKRVAHLKPVPFRVILPPEYKTEREYFDAITRGEVSADIQIQLFPTPPE